MSWLVCADVPDEYVPMLLEEMELDGADGRQVALGSDEAERREFPVVVIGCGQSGLLAGIRLKEAGIPFTIVEKNAGVGGTWYENTYPGCRVDVGNHFYCYSFEPSDQWSEFFARQPELQRYFTDVMERHGVTPHVRWETEVVAARWDDDDGSWRVRTRSADGTEETLAARAVISAVGQLNRPHLPDIAGRDSFAGPSFHSARWDHDVDLDGKRVALVGAGASGFQIAPAIADRVEHLTVFQRTAQWMFPNPNYHERVGPGVQWALRHLPFYGRWYRFLIFWPACDGGLAAARVDPSYPDQQRAVSETNEITRQIFTEWITSQVGDDPDLLTKVVPDYPATGKRTLQDNGSWLRTLTRDDVELVRDGIDHIEADAIVTESGERHEVDVIAYATGFHANRFLWPMEVVGRDGAVLADEWGDEPKAYLGITVPGFPNLFCMYGPGTNLAHGGSLIFHSECQMRYIVGCIDLLLRTGFCGDRAEGRGARGVLRADPARARRPGVGATVDPALVVQEPAGPHPRAQPVAARRLLGLDQGTRPGRLHAALTGSPRSRRSRRNVVASVKTRARKPLASAAAALRATSSTNTVRPGSRENRSTASSKIAGSGLASRSVPDTTTPSRPASTGQASRIAGQTSWGMFVSPNCGTRWPCSSSTISVVPGTAPPIIST